MHFIILYTMWYSPSSHFLSDIVQQERFPAVIFLQEHLLLCWKGQNVQILFSLLSLLNRLENLIEQFLIWRTFDIFLSFNLALIYNIPIMSLDLSETFTKKY